MRAVHAVAHTTRRAAKTKALDGRRVVTFSARDAVLVGDRRIELMMIGAASDGLAVRQLESAVRSPLWGGGARWW